MEHINFNYLNKNYDIFTIYGSIDINNIENYLKRMSLIKKEHKQKIDIVVIPNNYIYDIYQLYWAIFNCEQRFLEKMNISKQYDKELLLILNCDKQINKIDKEWFIKKDKQNYFLIIIDRAKNKNVKKIFKQLKIKEKKIKYNKTKAINFYGVKNNKNTLKEIIEKMSTSLL